MEGVRRFRDKRTGKNYVKFINGVVLEVVNDSDLELVEIGAEDCTYRHGYTCHSDRKIADVVKDTYRLKDTLDVPVGDKIVTFVVEHINKTDEYDDVYFVSRNIVGKSSIDDMEKYLDDFTDKMPKELVDSMKIIEHITNVDGKDFNVVFKRRVNLLSYANLTKTDRCFGKDDILFDGLQTEAERCKNDNYKATDWYWTYSPALCNATSFMYVYSYGYFGYKHASYVLGVVPCFSIRIYNGEAF